MLRRNLIRGAALAGASSLARVHGANDRIRTAVIGCGTRGTEALLPAALTYGAEVAAVCDVYKANLDRALSQIHSKGGGAAAGFSDWRRVLDRKDIDAVLVATPDHWHSPITVAACAAGKDVYVEKPLANDIEGCLKVVEAEARYKRIVQVGVQQRSSEIYFMALRAIKEGKIGPVRRCSMVWGADTIGPRREPEPETAVPDGLDWEAFQGPAPRRPYRASRQRRWRGYWEYGSGAITDFGVHLLDVARWFLEAGVPDSSFGSGCHSPGRPAEQVPDMVDLTWKWPGVLATYSSRRDEWFNTFWGEGGSLAVNRNLMRIKLSTAGPRTQAEEVKSPETGQQGNAAHMRNFLDCVKSRRKPNADAVTGSDSTIACLLAALSVRTGRAYAFDGRAAKAI